MEGDLARIETAREFFSHLQAFVEDVDATIRINRDFTRMADHCQLLEEQVLHYRSALHLIGTSFLSSESAEQRLDRITEVLSEALAKFPEPVQPYGRSLMEDDVEGVGMANAATARALDERALDELARQTLAQEDERANG